jgi:hypothetical protein
MNNFGAFMTGTLTLAEAALVAKAEQDRKKNNRKLLLVGGGALLLGLLAGFLYGKYAK